MFKKFVAFLLIFTLISPMTFAANASEASATPTIEEILNEYFEKSLQETGNVSPLSLNEYPLGKEAVDALTNAGYEAYYVTSSDYASLEDELMTDFNSLGLDPTESYVVVISGDDNDEVAPYGFSGPGASEDILDGTSSSFTYTQDGVTYTMRTVTVTSVEKPSYLSRATTYTLAELNNKATYSGNIFKALAYTGVGIVSAGLSSSSSTSLLSSWTRNSSIVVNDTSAFLLSATTIWTKKHIQVWDENSQKWCTSQCSSYAHSTIQALGDVYDTGSGSTVAIDSGKKSFETFSAYYNDTASRWRRAVEGYQKNLTLSDCTGNIYFYFFDASGSPIMSSGSALFYHSENTAVLIPNKQDP